MNTELMFSKASDEWSTPQDLFDALDKEFGFDLDAAATRENCKVQPWLDPMINALIAHWHDCGRIVWLNPPYSKVNQFIEKAALEASCGCTVVCLIPARTDTRMWHSYVWDTDQHKPRPGVEVRFLKGRLKFGNSRNSAPFPSAVVIFRPPLDFAPRAANGGLEL